MPLSLEQYATYLDTRDMQWPAPPEVEPVKAKPHLVRLNHIKAVTWNLYGTLLAVTSGDLVFEHPKEFVMEVALDKTCQEFNMWASMSRKPGQPADYLHHMYSSIVADQRNTAGVANKNPETLSDKVWETIIKRLLQKNYKFDAGFFGALNEFSCKVAYFFHTSLQGVRLFPNADQALRYLHTRKIAQGLIADCQFFSLLQLQRCLGREDPRHQLDKWIDPDLRALSFQHGIRKPNEKMFRHVLNALKDRGISPEQVLHVSSRVSTDIVPAKKLGMKTALFVGDATAVEATPEQLKKPESRPDILMTDLSQISEVAGSS